MKDIYVIRDNAQDITISMPSSFITLHTILQTNLAARRFY